MNVANTIGKGVAWSTIGTTVGKVIVLLNIFVILRYLSVYEYGLSELVLSVISSLGIILLPGLSTAIIADMSLERSRKAYGEMKSIFQQYFILNLVLGIIAWAPLFFGATWIAKLVGNVSIGYFLQIISFSFLISPFRMIATMMTTIELRFFDQSFYSVVEEIVKGVLLVIFIVLLGKGIEGLLYATVLSQVIAFIIFIPRTLSALQTFIHASAEKSYHFWNMLRSHRKWSIAGSYLSSLTQTAQLWIIRLMLGTVAVGLYSVASGILSQVSALLPFGNILSPIAPAYVDKRDELVRLIRASLKVQVVMSIGLLVVSLLLLPIFIFIFPKYASAAPLAAVLLVGIIPLAMIGIFTPIFSAFKKQLSFSFSVTVLTLLLFPAGITAFGLIGVGIANTLVTLISTGERYWRLRRTLPELTIRGKDFYSLTQGEHEYANVLLVRLRSRIPFFTA
jgi:O-antigen/teichoic acid export membrane protein